MTGDPTTRERPTGQRLAIVLVTRDCDVEQIDLATFALERENRTMRTDLDHLPDIQQQELKRVVAILREEFSKAISTATQPWKKNGKILKVILFGSNSRDDWVDIARDGVALYELPGSALATPQPLTATDAYEMANRYFTDWLDRTDSAMKLARFAIENGETRDAAFMLHQATERAYACFLLTSTFYFPRSHNIKFLRSLSEDHDQRLVEAWPRESRPDRRRYELLKKAYVEARYSTQYDVTEIEINWLGERIGHLRDVVEVAGSERLAALAIASGS